MLLFFSSCTCILQPQTRTNCIYDVISIPLAALVMEWFNNCGELARRLRFVGDTMFLPFFMFWIMIHLLLLKTWFLLISLRLRAVSLSLQIYWGVCTRARRCFFRNEGLSRLAPSVTRRGHLCGLRKKDKTARSVQITLKWLWRYSFKHPFSFYGSALTEKSTPLKFLPFKVMFTLPSCASFPEESLIVF